MVALIPLVVIGERCTNQEMKGAERKDEGAIGKCTERKDEGTIGKCR